MQTMYIISLVTKHKKVTMFISKLPFDYCRCSTQQCVERENCLRYKTQESDKKAPKWQLFSYSVDMCQDSRYKYKIEPAN